MSTPFFSSSFFVRCGPTCNHVLCEYFRQVLTENEHFVAFANKLEKRVEERSKVATEPIQTQMWREKHNIFSAVGPPLVTFAQKEQSQQMSFMGFRPGMQEPASTPPASHVGSVRVVDDRTLFRESQLAEQMELHVARGIQVAVQGFSSPDWGTRNAATMLYTAACNSCVWQ